MLHRIVLALKKSSRLFSRYPLDASVHPQLFERMGWQGKPPEAASVLAMQSVPDRFYFLLFGAIRTRLQMISPHSAKVLVLRAVSGAIGTGWRAELKRSAFVARLISSPWIRAYGSLVNGVAYRSASYGHPVQDLKDWIKSKYLWQQLQRQGDQLSLQVGGVEVADLLVDSYLRFRPSPTFAVTDTFVRRLIWQALRDARCAHRYFGQIKPFWYLSSYATYLEHGIAVRVALQNQVPVWTFASFSQFGKRLSDTDSFHTADFSQYRSGFSALDGQRERLLAAQQVLDKRLAGGVDAATSYMRQSAYGRTDVVLPLGLDGAVVVFLHDFYDSPHVYPELIFLDFWRWICFTIEVLQKECIPFFLKPHPNQIALGDEVLVALRHKFPFLRWIESSVNNLQLVQAGIAFVVTVYGTVAHELAYLGVPSIGCALHPHHSFDFCRTARNQDEYATMLRTFMVLPVSKEEMKQQALAFFYMHNLYGSTEQLALRDAFIELWKTCNMKSAQESEVLQALEAMTTLPAFDRFVRIMAEGSSLPKTHALAG